MCTSAELFPGKGRELLITEFAGKAAMAVFPVLRYEDLLEMNILNEGKDG